MADIDSKGRSWRCQPLRFSDNKQQWNCDLLRLALRLYRPLKKMKIKNGLNSQKMKHCKKKIVQNERQFENFVLQLFVA